MAPETPSVPLHAVIPIGSTLTSLCRTRRQREEGQSLFLCVCFIVTYVRYDTIAEGIGNDHVTGNFAKAVVDDAFKVSDQEAVYMAHYLLRHEGKFYANLCYTSRTIPVPKI